MDYRKLGKTDLNLSLIGFGGAALGGVFGNVDPGEGMRAVHLAVDSGINFFDTSPYYGITLAETRLGAALVGRRDRVIVATKCGRYGMDEFDFSAKRVTASMDESLQRLQTDYVDLFQVHDLEFGDARQIIEETIPALRRLQQQGKARYVGITGYPPKILRRIAEGAPVDSILTYCHYNLMNTDMDEVLTTFARDRGIGLINAAALHMGILTETGPAEWHPAPGGSARRRKEGGRILPQPRSGYSGCGHALQPGSPLRFEHAGWDGQHPPSRSKPGAAAQFHRSRASESSRSDSGAGVQLCMAFGAR